MRMRRFERSSSARERTRASGGVRAGGGRRDPRARWGYAPVEGDVRAIFRRWNSEGDRTLSLAEFKGIFGRKYELGNPALVEQLTRRAMERDIGELFSKIDKNHDGPRVQARADPRAEKRRGVGSSVGPVRGRHQGRLAPRSAFFVQFDADGDKQLSMEEFSEVFLKSKTNGAKTAAVGTEVIVMPDVGVDPLTVDYLFAKIDKDGNGKLSIRELVTSFARTRAWRRSSAWTSRTAPGTWTTTRAPRWRIGS